MCLDYERKQIFILGRYLDASMRTAENLKVNKRLHYCLIFTLLPHVQIQNFFSIGGWEWHFNEGQNIMKDNVEQHHYECFFNFKYHCDITSLLTYFSE